jgi:hypothetical protein
VLARPLNMIEQGNLLTSIRRDIARIQLQLARLVEHLELPPVTEEEVDDVLADDPDFDPRTGASPLGGRPGLKPAPPLSDAENPDWW